MLAGVKRRLLREINRIFEIEMEGVIFETADENNPFNIYGYIIGPSETPYEGGKFRFFIDLTKEYPFNPPKFFFKTKIFHPNVFEDGIISLDILKGDWNPFITVPQIIEYVISILHNPDYYLGNFGAACLYFYDYEKY